MNLRKVLWSRLTLGVLSVTFVLFYIVQYRKYHADYTYLANKCSKLMVHSGGLSAQLQMLMERNHRAEKLLTDLHAKYTQLIKENSEKRQSDKAQWLLCQGKLKKCLTETPVHIKNNDEKGKFLQVFQPSRYHSPKSFSSMSGMSFAIRATIVMKMKEFKNQIEEMKREARNISVTKDECKKLLENSQIADPLPKSNYVQDGKVHFERLGPLNEELEFRRDRIPPQLPTLLSKKGLLARLSMRNEHHELVPDNAAEIVDVPEQEYKDYKDA